MNTKRREHVENCRKAFEEFMATKPPVIIRYIKRGATKKKGVVIVVKREEDEEPYIGWSLCRNKEPFNKYIGLHLAIERAFKSYQVAEEEDLTKLIPVTVWKELDKMSEDVDKKFKLSPEKTEQIESTDIY